MSVGADHTRDSRERKGRRVRSSMVGRIRTCTSVQRKDLAVEGEVAR